MHKPKPYKCSICGAEVPDLPMTVLKHQMSHVTRRLLRALGMSPAAPIHGRAIWNGTTRARTHKIATARIRQLMSASPPRAAEKRTCREVRVGPAADLDWREL